MTTIEAESGHTSYGQNKELSQTEEQITRINRLRDADTERMQELREEQAFLELRTGVYRLLEQGALQANSVGLYMLEFDQRGKLRLRGGKAHIDLQASQNVRGEGELAEMRVPIVGRFTYADVPRGYEASSYGGMTHLHEHRDTTEIVDFGVIDELQWYGEGLDVAQEPNIDTHHITFMYDDTPHILTGIPLSVRQIRQFIDVHDESDVHGE